MASALVTELAYVPDSVADGLYLLDLQVPAFGADAAPSRPVLYPLRPLTGDGDMRLDREHAHALDAADPLAAWHDASSCRATPAAAANSCTCAVIHSARNPCWPRSTSKT